MEIKEVKKLLSELRRARSAPPGRPYSWFFILEGESGEGVLIVAKKFAEAKKKAAFERKKAKKKQMASGHALLVYC